MSVPVVGRPGAATVVSPAADELSRTLRSRRAKRKPSSVPEDVWEIVEELEANGGLFDFNIEIARLEREFHHLEVLGEMQGEILPLEQLKMRVKLAERILAAKAKALDAQLKTKDVVDINVMRLCMEGVATALRQNIADPHLIQRIGDQIGSHFRAVLLQARGARS